VDLSVLGKALMRYKWLVAVGVMVAAALAALSLLTVSFGSDGVTVGYRDAEKWTSTSTVWVTQAGFPLGRTVYDQCFAAGDSKVQGCIPKLTDPANFGGRATLYASLVSSDAVRKLMERDGRIDGTVGGAPTTAPNNQNFVLPFFVVSGTAASPAKARSLTERATEAMIVFVRQQQAASEIPQAKRVVLQIVRHATPAALTGPRSKTRPIAIFLAGVLVVLGLALLLYNRRMKAAEALPPGRERSADAPPPVPVADPFGVREPVETPARLSEALTPRLPNGGALGPDPDESADELELRRPPYGRSSQRR
jgi:hypothetical protein